MGSSKKFKVGGDVVTIDIQDTNSTKIGLTRFETTRTLSAAVNISSANAVHIVNNGVTTTISNTTISNSAGTGLGTLAESINKYTDKTGVIAKAVVQTTASSSVLAGNIKNLVINNITLGDIYSIKADDDDGRLVDIINASSRLTGVTSFMDSKGRLNLQSLDGRGININTTSGLDNTGISTHNSVNYGRLTLTAEGASDILISSSALSGAIFNNSYEASLSMGSVREMVVSNRAQAIGGFANTVLSSDADKKIGLGVGVTSKAGAMMTMDLADSAIHYLSKVRSTLGSVQNQLESKVNSLMVAGVSLSSAESQIRDADFAEESMQFSKGKILAQSGNFSLSQASKIFGEIILSYLK
jgi:flagellin